MIYDDIHCCPITMYCLLHPYIFRVMDTTSKALGCRCRPKCSDLHLALSNLVQVFVQQLQKFAKGLLSHCESGYITYNKKACKFCNTTC